MIWLPNLPWPWPRTSPSRFVGAGEGQRVLQMCRRMSLDDLRLNHDAIIATTQRTDTNTRPAMTSSLALGSRPKRHFLVRWLAIQFFWKKMSTEMAEKAIHNSSGYDVKAVWQFGVEGCGYVSCIIPLMRAAIIYVFIFWIWQELSFSKLPNWVKKRPLPNLPNLHSRFFSISPGKKELPSKWMFPKIVVPPNHPFQ